MGPAPFDPERYAEDEALQDAVRLLLDTGSFRDAITKAFDLDPDDDYVYHAGAASVTLAQAQRAIDAGPANGLHDWYVDDDGRSLGNPPAADIAAYTAVFDPANSAPKALRSLASNAKKGSLRAAVGAHLLSARHLDAARHAAVPRQRQRHFFNPYLDFWARSCRDLQWGGPTAGAAGVRTSHHVLPVLMHHFGCAVPSREALELVRQAATVDGDGRRRSRTRAVCDVGSGTGYWAFLLRRHHGLRVHAVDSLQSVFRTRWVRDTVVDDGARWLRARAPAAAADADDGDDQDEDLLLLVYPVVGARFTARMLDAYAGPVVVVAATQNASGYSAFADRTVDRYMADERPAFRMTARVPLPSFAGKDDALFVFRRD